MSHGGVRVFELWNSHRGGQNFSFFGSMMEEIFVPKYMELNTTCNQKVAVGDSFDGWRTNWRGHSFYKLKLILTITFLRPRPHYAGVIWKRRFHSENASNVFRPHRAGEIWKRNNHRRQKRLSAPVSMRIAITISTAILDLCLRKTRADKSPDYRDVIVFEKLRFQKCSPSTLKRKAPFSNSSVFKSVFEKLRFRWTIFPN